MGSLEVWKATVHVAGTAEAVARQTEHEGFDGLAFGDTQHLAADPYAGLCLAAQSTRRLRLAVAVTNPCTRHPAVTANAITTLQVVSGGRAVLGIGRGTSTLRRQGAPGAARAQLLSLLVPISGG